MDEGEKVRREIHVLPFGTGQRATSSSSPTPKPHDVPAAAEDERGRGDASPTRLPIVSDRPLPHCLRSSLACTLGVRGTVHLLGLGLGATPLSARGRDRVACVTRMGK